ncbi:phage portal protein [Phyllobacterium zundukense]|uniref:Phage portal protein n=1 Tax=Phyllobacterium zundukense TaxID=1867719 RepID=A0A2N9W445_9HYPH|nr:phage portal protein [Phyllobacterium zundukense]ATU92016.1 phage portal protein [Phyllobacterium zundukense]PIO46513.1 phage portal protein [Phyllobacterium zundukense]
MSVKSRLSGLFGLGSQPSFEQKAFPLNSAEAFALFGSGPTTAGPSVGPISALHVPAVLQAVRIISENTGSLPCKVYRKTDDGKEEANDHPAYKLVHRFANDWTSAGKLREQLTADALTYGYGFAYVNRVNGNAFELTRFLPGTLQIVIDQDTGEPYFHSGKVKGKTQTRYHYSDILHIPAFGDIAPVRSAREAIALAIVLEKHAAQLFAGGARPAAMLYKETTTPANEAGTNAIRNILSGWRKAFANGHNGDPLILDGGYKYQQLALSSTDAQFAEMRTEQIREIARAFGIPPHMLFELSRATWSNAEQMGASFLQLCLRPWLDRWQDAYNLVLFNDEERDEYFCEFVIDDLMRADSAARADNFSKLIAARVMTPNEARAAMNLPAMEGGDELANPHINPTPALPAPIKESTPNA